MIVEIENSPTLEQLRKVVEYVNRNIEINAFDRIATDKKIPSGTEKVWFEKLASGGIVCAIAFHGDKVVGASHIDIEHGRRKHCGRLAITVDIDYRRKGIASKLLTNIIEQCRQKGINNIRAEPPEDNIPAINLFKKFNFEYEGRRGKAFLSNDGQYKDLVEFTLILSQGNEHAFT